MSLTKTISILGAGWLGASLGAELVKHGWLVKGATTRLNKFPELQQIDIKPFLIKVENEITGNHINEFFTCDILFINIPPGRRHPDVEQRFPEQVRLIIEKIKPRDINQVIFISSTSVYGDATGEVTEEDTPTPSTASGKALFKAEQYLKDQLKNKLTLLRPAGLVGGKRRPGKWFAGKKNLSGGNIPVNMIHRQDCIQIILQLIEKSIWGEDFNLCADEHPVKGKFYPHQAKKDGLAAPSYQTNCDSKGKIICNKKIKAALGYTFQFPDPMDF